MTNEEVFYIYVENDVTVSAEANEVSFSKASAFSFELKEGWNSVYIKEVWGEGGAVVTASLSNPSGLHWVIEDY